ncbi:hypothetical protein [Ewingella americana]|uniref:hypothetical protein n=1 Tax=Ewingella americana TaxID=41202 RepID=UPI001639E582|nr:hypothetical protein [Ewingella americana]QMV50927.1 hypothetical protein GXP68_05850 [Ewingella americana]
MTISKQLSPVGYLNKMTGHIWTPTEQPNAADEPGLYEPLVLSREALAEVQQKDALQLSVDNILRGLGITGDGPFSQLVLDKFIAILAERDALAAENTYLLPKAASELSNAWLLHRTMMGAQAALKCLERGDYSATREWLEGTTDEAQLEIPDGLATGELQKWFDENLVGLISNSQAMKLIKAETPATDAAIANTQADALDVFANAAEEQLAKGKDKADVIDTGFNLGAEAMISMLRMSANALRAGRKG